MFYYSFQAKVLQIKPNLYHILNLFKYLLIITCYKQTLEINTPKLVHRCLNQSVSTVNDKTGSVSHQNIALKYSKKC